MEVYSLLERYRLDRRKLLEFVLSSGSIREIRTPSGIPASLSDINLDYISTDYVLHCVQSGGVLDVALATRKYHEEFELPIMTDLQSGDCYFLRSDPESAGSPPRRPPPPVLTSHSADNRSGASKLGNSSTYKDFAESGIEYGSNYVNATATETDSANTVDIPDLGLPSLETGFLKDYWMMTCGNQLTKHALQV